MNVFNAKFLFYGARGALIDVRFNPDTKRKRSEMEDMRYEFQSKMYKKIYDARAKMRS